MASVAGFARRLKQPKGGYLNPRCFTVTKIDPTFEVFPDERLPVGYPMVEGICVETLVRVANGMSADQVLAYIFRRNTPEIIDHFPKLVAAFKREVAKLPVTGLSDALVPLIYRLFQFAWWYLPRRGHTFPPGGVDEDAILDPVFIPTAQQVYTIRRMAENSVKFTTLFGPMDFTPVDLTGGFTKKIRSGEIDFRTVDTIWDIKDSKTKPNRFHTLQVLMYYLVEKHATHHDPRIRRIGIFNPRLSTAYTLEVAQIDPALLAFVEHDLMGYPRDDAESDTIPDPNKK